MSKQGLLLLSCFSRVRLCTTPYMAAHQAPPSLGFSRQNTAVGCHFLLQCMKVKSEREVTQLCLTLSDPMGCSLPGSSIHGIFHARVLEWGAIAFSDFINYAAVNIPMLTLNISAPKSRSSGPGYVNYLTLISMLHF